MSDAPRQTIRLDGKVALVTGGNRGLGREMALGFARAGADIVSASRHEDACAEFAAALRDELGVRAIGVGVHVGRWDTLDGFVERVYGEMGSVDVLVNNAGMSPLYDWLDSVSEELFDKVLAVNLKGPFPGSRRSSARAWWPVMAARSSTSRSVGAMRPAPDDLPYAAAKAGPRRARPPDSRRRTGRRCAVQHGHGRARSSRTSPRRGTWRRSPSPGEGVTRWGGAASRNEIVGRGGLPGGRRGPATRRARSSLLTEANPDRFTRTGTPASTTQTCLTSRRRSADTPATSQTCPSSGGRRGRVSSRLPRGLDCQSSGCGRGPDAGVLNAVPPVRPRELGEDLTGVLPDLRHPVVVGPS